MNALAGTRTFGTEAEGFSVGAGDGSQAVHLRLWGFWSSELSAQLVAAVVAACVDLKARTMTIDATGLKPLRDVAQEAVGSLLSSLPALGVTQAMVTTDSPLMKLQMMRIAKERAAKAAVRFLA